MRAMIRQLITLPLRSTRRGAELLIDGASRALSLAWELTGRSEGEPSGAPAGQRDTPREPAAREASASSQNGSAQPPYPAGQSGATEAPPRPTARPVDPPDPPDPPASLEPSEPESLHIDDEPELVAETADPGAADGAGAELRIDEPWPGYRQLNADEIIARLPAASAAELAVMELYEATHKRRRTVLSALQRQLSDK